MTKKDRKLIDYSHESASSIEGSLYLENAIDARLFECGVPYKSSKSNLKVRQKMATEAEIEVKRIASLADSDGKWTHTFEDGETLGIG